MSLRSVVESCLCIDTFINIDLYSQGYYFMRFKMFYERPSQNLRVTSCPYANYLTSCLEEKE